MNAHSSRNAAAAAQVPLDPWSAASQQLVLAWRDRLKKTADSLPKFDGDQPVRLHKNAVTEISVVLTLPAGSKDFLGAAAPAETKVYYTRTTFTPANPKEQSQIAEHYEERAAGQRRADPQKGILWIDGVRTLSSGERRTMDVVIQQAANVPTQGGFVAGVGAGADLAVVGGAGAGGGIAPTGKGC